MQKTSTGNNARFRQERTMGRASQWFVFPSARRGGGGGGGGLFSCCDVKRSLLFFCPLPQRWVCHSDLYHHSCPPPHNCVNLQHTQYISMYSLVSVCMYLWVTPCYILGVLQIALPPPSLLVETPVLPRSFSFFVHF